MEQQQQPLLVPKPSPSPSPNPKPNRDFLTHLETYLSKRDGIDKLLKISRYAAKIAIASSPHISPRFKSFESSVGLSRKAFRLGKFVQDLNALRLGKFDSRSHLVMSLLCYGGEGIYYFVEQIVWLVKTGLIEVRDMRRWVLISAWAEFIGYFGSISLKVRDLRMIAEDEQCLKTSIEVSSMREEACAEMEERIKKLREKKLMKRLSVIQDFADGLMALADIRDGKGKLSAPLLLSSAGMVSALISTHKNWVSC